MTEFRISECGLRNVFDLNGLNDFKDFNGFNDLTNQLDTKRRDDDVELVFLQILP